MLLTEAFKVYKAKLKNYQWSVCAKTPNDELVISLWSHLFCDLKGNTIKYKDNVDRWSGLGNDEFRKALNEAKEKNQTIRAVIVTTDNPSAIKDGEAGSNVSNSFSVREDWYGQLTVWDGENYEIKFDSKND